MNIEHRVSLLSITNCNELEGRGLKAFLNRTPKAADYKNPREEGKGYC